MHRFPLAVLLVVAPAACASTPSKEVETLALYRQHAGEPIDGFAWFGQMKSWTPLGDDAVAIWLGTRAYLLEFDAPCPDIDFARGVSLTSGAGRVSARFDRLTPIGTGSPIPCRIDRIRQVDVPALRAAQKAARAAARRSLSLRGDSSSGYWVERLVVAAPVE